MGSVSLRVHVARPVPATAGHSPGPAPLSPSDWELIERARRWRAAGGASSTSATGADAEASAATSAFAALFERHSKPVYSFLLRLTGDPAVAEDLTQEAFLSAYRHLAGLRPERVAGGQQASLRPWLMRVSRNLAVSYFRKSRLLLGGRPATDPAGRTADMGRAPALENVPDPAGGPEAAALRSETVAEVRQAVARLAPRYREPVILYYAAGLTYGEIAGTLGLPAGTVATRLRRALAILGREIGQGGGGPWA